MEWWQAEGGRRRPGDPPGWTRPWRTGFLAAFVLSFSFLLAQGQPSLSKTAMYNITIFTEPPVALEGQTVNLTLKYNAANFAFCNWYRGTDVKENLIVTFYLPPINGNTTGPSYTGREVAGFGCSLFINNLHLNDSGTYVVTMNGPSVHGKGDVKIQVLGAVLKVTVTGPSHVVENQPVTFRCSSLGFNVSYSWLKGGQPIEAGGNFLVENNNLTLLSTSRSDATSYTCSGQNSFSANNSEPHRLEIFYGPEHPVISPLQRVYNEHSTLNLFCSAVSNPPAKFSWYLNGELLQQHNDSHLTQRLTLKNAGNYTCKVTNVETGLSNTAILEISIREAINHISIRDPGKVVENSTTYLNCTASGFNVSYYWLKGNQKLQAGGHISLSSNGQNLSLSRTSRQDSGVYTCSGINSFSNNSANYTLNVFYGPDAPVISPGGQFYAEGSNLTLSCQADSNPPANYTWSFKNSTHSGGIYQLFRLSSANNGTYTCEASNNETKLSQSKVQPICVLEKLSKPILWPSNSLVAENARFTLNCSTSSSSTVKVTWSKDSKPFPTNVEFDHENRTLTLRKFQQPDAGTYTCTAKHLLGAATSNPSILTLAYGPRSAQLNRTGTIEEPLGSELVLQCSAESVPRAKFEWFFNNTVNNGTEDTLNVHLKDWEDEGNYTCQAMNPFTTHTTSASVYVKLTDESAIQPRMSVAAIAGTTIGSVAGVVLCVIVVYVIWTKVSCWKKEQHASNGNIPSAPGHNQATDTKSKLGEEDIQYSTLAFNTKTASQPLSKSPRPLDSGIIYSEIKKK
ncbi:carcinoembryonic antigen-related cell adhesion molecule 5-like isoform X1 [Pantherophis guttatus]|uniref:Carcinoembryonic antigen-related cell adhesion molecule 5-like isoform X1 n=1 Tax=Pantherophis guttatus TaxID=94885 RepID=A0A6P9DE61_PANGU|nr:carcinoembryonic antigen-related cell adhesion molecule 5-like isoform X1 [Pantherophis guttatus]